MVNIFLLQIAGPIISFYLLFNSKDEIFRASVVLSFLIALFVSFFTFGSIYQFGGWGVIFGLMKFNFSFTQLYYLTILFCFYSFLKGRMSVLNFIWLVLPLFLTASYVLAFLEASRMQEDEQIALKSLDRIVVESLPDTIVYTGSGINEKEFLSIPDLEHSFLLKNDGNLVEYERVAGRWRFVDRDNIALPKRYLMLKAGAKSAFAMEQRDDNGRQISRNIYAYELSLVDGNDEHLVAVSVKTSWFKPIFPPSISHEFKFVKSGSRNSRRQKTALRALLQEALLKDQEPEISSN